MLPTSGSTRRSCTSLPKRVRTSAPPSRRPAGAAAAARAAARAMPRTLSRRLRDERDARGRAARAPARRGSGGAGRATRRRRPVAGEVSDRSEPETGGEIAGVGDPREEGVGALVDRRPAGERRGAQLAAGPGAVVEELDGDRAVGELGARAADSRSATVTPAMPPPTTTTRRSHASSAIEGGQRARHAGVVVHDGGAGEHQPGRLGALAGLRCRGRRAPRGDRPRTRTGTPAAPSACSAGPRSSMTLEDVRARATASAVRPADCHADRPPLQRPRPAATATADAVARTSSG